MSRNKTLAKSAADAYARWVEFTLVPRSALKSGKFRLANAVSETVISVEPVEAPAFRRPAWRLWGKRVLLLLLLLWVAEHGLTLVIRHTPLQRRITARLESAFGRHVEVAGYSISLWGGPALEAHSISVGEDTRFGHEYFLRADSLTLRLRWQSLLTGNLNFGTVSLERPSLNLVHNSDGDWNLAEWLPQPSIGATPARGDQAIVGPAPPLPATPSLRLSRIEVEGGRINFKREADKLPFAFTGVKGFVEPDGPGRWRMDLQATPERAAVVVQQAGTLRLTGHVGGTSSRLRPAELQFSWRDASVSDVLRLLRGYDYGLRGSLSLFLNSNTQSANTGWQVEGRAELRQLHRWDMASRPDNPAVNLFTRMQWYPAASAVYFEEAGLEAPHSNAHARGGFSWGEPPIIQKRPVSPLAVELRSAIIDLRDFLSWFRAFHPGVADDISVQGTLEASGHISGWPIQIVNARVSNLGAEVSGKSLRVPVHLSEINLHYDKGLGYLEPLTIFFGASGGSVRIEASRKSRTLNGLSTLRISGNLAQVRDVVATAGALGWNISRGWDVAGPMRCDLRWDGGELPWQAQPVGFVEWGAERGGALQAPFLNQPVEQIKARAEWKPGGRHIAIASASAFGARWTGTFDRRETDAQWQFGLSADRLAASDLDRWLNPRWRDTQSLVARMLPFLNPRSVPVIAPDNLFAVGKISIDQFTLAPLSLRRLQGDLEIAGRRMQLRNARAQSYGGELNGAFDAELAAPPVYRARLDFSRLDLAALASASPGLADLFVGSASGKISLSARGGTRADLLASLVCQGTSRMNNLEFHNLNLLDSLHAGARRPGVSSFREASSAFTCGDGGVRFQNLLLLGPGFEMDAAGSVDFARDVDFRVRVVSGPASIEPARATAAATGNVFALTGPLAAPRIARATAPSARP
jgi:AsmA-like C-terminal region/AsmA family